MLGAGSSAQAAAAATAHLDHSLEEAMRPPQPRGAWSPQDDPVGSWLLQRHLPAEVGMAPKGSMEDTEQLIHSAKRCARAQPCTAHEAGVGRVANRTAVGGDNGGGAAKYWAAR